MPTIKTDFFIPPEGRFCYPFLDTPRMEDLNGKRLDDPKYETVFYIPKTSANPQECRVYQQLAAKIMEVVNQAFRGQWPERDWKNWPIRDGDAELEKSPWGAGCWRIACHGGKFRPPGYDAGNNPLQRDVTDRYRDFKGGDYGYVSINCFSYDNITKGVSFGLEMFKKSRDGDPIGGGGARPVEAVFGAPTGQPVQSFMDPRPAQFPPPLPNGVYGGAPPVGYAGQPPQQAPYAGPQQGPQSNFSQSPSGYGGPFGPGAPPQVNSGGAGQPGPGMPPVPPIGTR